MKNLFVITASNQKARQHIHKTVDNSIPTQSVLKHFDGSELEEARAIDKDGYYAWGAIPGPRNTRFWEELQVDDTILIYQSGSYTYRTRVVFKPRRQMSQFALENWGTDESGKTWEHVYFLEKPYRFAEPIGTGKLAKYLLSQYMGFTKIAGARIQRIVSDYGTIDDFLETEFPVHEASGLSVSFWWVCQGHSYRTGSGEHHISAPKSLENGKPAPYHWKNLERVTEGDVVFHYASGAIRSVSLAVGKPFATAYPYDYKESDDWPSTTVKVHKHDIDAIEMATLTPHVDFFRTSLKDAKGPFDKSGGVKQGYLFEFNYESAIRIRQVYGKQFPPEIEKLFGGAMVPISTPSDPVLDLLNMKLQIILYGPPGTGKTYDTRRLAVLLLTG